MNRDWILFHLKEAEEELHRTITEIETDEEYDCGELFIAMRHMYNHLNTAWNSKDESQSRVESEDDELFYKWRKFPIDIDLE